MQVRTQIVVVALVAVGWAAGNATNVRPVMAETQRTTRAALENAVARDPGDVVAARALTALYFEERMWSLLVQTVARCSNEVQQDARVVVFAAHAHEQLGEIHRAAAMVQGAMARCEQTPPELAEHLGCDPRTRTALNAEADALDRMIQRGISPLSDPAGAQLAHDLSVRPIRLVVPR